LSSAEPSFVVKHSMCPINQSTTCIKMICFKRLTNIVQCSSKKTSVCCYPSECLRYSGCWLLLLETRCHPRVPFVLLELGISPVLQRFQETFIDRWELAFQLLIPVACCWQVGRPIGLIGSPAGASDPSSVSSSTRRSSCAWTLPVMPFAAVTNYVRLGLEMNREITKYFADYDTPPQVCEL
jgi:hypothetical protein